MKVELKDIDRLYNIALDLAIITYLHGLVLREEDAKNYVDSKIKLNSVDVYNYLLDLQYNCINELQELIYKDDFAI